MRVAAFLGFILFGGLTILLGYQTYKAYLEEKEGDILTHPFITGVIISLGGLTLALLCLVYSLGLWDALVGWLHAGDSGHFVIRPY